MAPTMSRQDTRARAEEAWRLQAAGRTLDEIAVELGYGTRSAVHSAIRRLDQRSPVASADAVRRSSSEGLRVVRAVLFERLADATERGDNEDITKLSRAIQSNIAENAKMHGAYAAQRTEIDVTVKSATAVIDRMEADLLAIAARQRGEVIDAEVIE